MGWVVVRITLALVIVGVLGYRWHQGHLTWPLILMSAFISGLLVLEMFTADRRHVPPGLDDAEDPIRRRRATDYKAGEVDAAVASEDSPRTSPGGP